MVTWNTLGLNQTNFWTTQVVVEDLDTNGNVKTKTPVDFMLKIVPQVGNPPSCTINPAGPFTVTAGSPVFFTVTGADPDPGATVTLNSAGLPGGATMTPALPVTGASGVSSTFNWTPTAAQAGSHVILFSATDNTEQQAQCSTTVNVSTNRPPVAVDDTATTTQNAPVTINVLANDSDPDGDPLTVISFTQGTNGTVSCAPAGACLYTPNIGFVGTDSFTYTISDGRGGTATATVRVTVTAALLTITGFTPTSGRVGTTVMITGTNFDPSAGKTTVRFSGVQAVITSITPTTIQTFVPIGATTGRITVETPGGTATSTADFVLELRQDFGLTVNPTAGKVIQGSSSSYSVEVKTVGGQPFTGLATLNLTGIPTGVTATFSPSTLTGGQRGLLTVTAASTASLGSVQLTARATAPIDAQTVTRSTTFDLTVLQGGRNVLLGQFMLKNGPPMPNVKLSLVSHVDGSILAQTTTDTGGNFVFLDPPTGTLTLSVDTTPFNPSVPMPIYGVDVTIVAGQATVLPVFTVTPPPPPQAFVPIQNATQDQVVTNTQFPGVSIKLPAGTTVTGWDGLVKTKIAIMRLTPDELPMPPPPGPTRSLYQFNFGTNMGGVPSVPLPVTLPNDQGLDPGTKAEIWYYDAAPFVGVPGAWRKAGLGTVSADGTVIVSDPGVGIERFCGVCGTTCIIQRATPHRNVDTTKVGDPVDVALGQQIEEKTDLVLPGRIPAVLHRTYNPFDPFGGVAGFELGLGPGWALSVEVVLLEVSGSLRRLILPGNARIDFAQQGIGSFANTTQPRFIGALLAAETGGRHRLRFKDGTSWRFDPHPNPQLAGTSLLAEQSDRNANRLTIERDAAAHISRIVEPAGRALMVTYNGNRISDVTDPIGRTVHYSYNPDGRLETVTNPSDGVTRYTYDSAGRILTITDPRGITYLTNDYDSNGRVFRQTQADGGVWTFQYLGEPGATTGVIATEPRANSTTHKFNAAALATETTDATGQVTKYERDSKGQLVATTDPLGRITRLEYDGAGNVTKITDPAANVRTFEYEPSFNRLTKATDPLANATQFAYDSQGNLTRITDPLGNVTQIAYNQSGQPISTTDPRGGLTRFEYDTFGNLSTVIDPLGASTRRAYDVVSRLIEQTDPRGNPTVHTYDPMDRLATRTDPVAAVESFQYDTTGNLVRHTDRKSQVNTFSYDPLNRRTGASYADGTTTRFVYDAAGRLTQASDSIGGAILNDYDLLDRLIRQTTELGSIAYSYDALGRRTSMDIFGQNVVVNYNYDANSRLRQVVQDTRIVTIAYDNLGRRTRLILPNGVSTDYTYDSASRLTELIYRNTAGVLGNLVYQYDRSGNRAGVSGSFARTLLPDPVSTAAHDAANRQLRFGDKAMIFDRNGNLTSLADPGSVTAFNWDARDRLANVIREGIRTSFTYDPFGRRIARQLDGELNKYFYDGVSIIREFVNGDPISYIRGLNIDEPLVRDGIEHYLADALGSTIGLTDALGTVRTEYSYEPFGSTGVTGVSSNPFQYTGRENHGPGLYFFRMRYFSPPLHRFLGEDPIGLNAGINPYEYVEGNPINSVDPFGLQASPSHIARVIIATALVINHMWAPIIQPSLKGVIPAIRGAGKLLELTKPLLLTGNETLAAAAAGSPATQAAGLGRGVTLVRLPGAAATSPALWAALAGYSIGSFIGKQIARSAVPLFSVDDGALVVSIDTEVTFGRVFADFFTGTLNPRGDPVLRIELFQGSCGRKC